jgi:hypothetical protein
MDLKRGEIYFIRERVGTEFTEFTKIGLVREKEGRSSADRAKEHQTGNPRLLSTVKVVQTAFVSAVEKTLHREFARERYLPGEWFKLDDEQLSRAVVRCQELAATNEAYVPLFEKADQLKLVTASSEVAPPSETAKEWRIAHGCAEAGKKLISESAARYKSFLIEVQLRGVDVESYLETTVAAGAKRWKEALFRERYPEIIRLFESEETALVPTFSVEKPKGEDFSSDARLSEVVFATSALDTAVAAAAETREALDEMFQLHLQLIGMEPALKELTSIAEANLKVLCDVNAGIEGVCKWPRAEKVRTVVDAAALSAAHPDEYASCYVVGDSVQKTSLRRGLGAGAAEE